MGEQYPFTAISLLCFPDDDYVGRCGMVTASDENVAGFSCSHGRLDSRRTRLKAVNFRACAVDNGVVGLAPCLMNVAAMGVDYRPAFDPI